LSELYIANDQFEKAKENLEIAQKGFQNIYMDFWLARNYAVYAELYKKEGDQPKANENMTKAIEIMKEYGADGWVEKYEKELSELS